MLLGSAPGAAPAAPRTGTQESLEGDGPQRMIRGTTALGALCRQWSHHQQADWRSCSRVGAGSRGSRRMPPGSAAGAVKGSHQVLLWVADGSHYILLMSGKRQTAIDDPEHWRRRALETRALAVAERKLWVKLRLERIAKSYEKVATLAEVEARLRQASPFLRVSESFTDPGQTAG